MRYYIVEHDGKVQTLKKKMTDQTKALCETTLEMQELAKEIYFYDT